MRLTCLLALAALLHHARAEEPLRRFLYASTPDAAQTEGRSGTGILVFDLDDGHRLARRIEVPAFKDGLRGLTGCAASHCLYGGMTSKRMVCFDVETERVVWERTFPAGCDRSSVTPDGKTLYIPTGFWDRTPESGFLVVNAADGSLLSRIPVGPQAHNSNLSLDGTRVYLGTETMLSAFDTANNRLVRQIRPVGEAGVFPFTVNRRGTRAYVCLGKHVGVDVVDLTEGKVLHRLLAGAAPIPHRTHGAGLTPDEKELWVSDQIGKKLFVFDLTQDPPAPKAEVELSLGGHGWVNFSLDGRFAWCHTPDVFDAATKQKVATLRDEKGNPFASSKFIEIHFRGGKVVAMGNEFGLGRAE